MGGAGWVEREAVSLDGVKVSILHCRKSFETTENSSLRGRGSHVEEQLPENKGLHGAHSETQARDQGLEGKPG